MTPAFLRRARNQDQAPPTPPDPVLLDAAHDAYIRELVLAARWTDHPVRRWLAPLEVIALEHAEADGYRRTP